METITLLHCYHCGDEITGGALQLDEKYFCCAGCQSVYQLLSQNQLCAYYAYHDTPGAKVKENSHLEYLDEESIITQLIDYRDDNSTIVTFYIPAIHCTSCIWLLEHLYKIDPAIFNTRIDFLKKEATISFKHQEVSLRKLVSLLNHIGYEPAINLQDVTKAHSKDVNKSLILKVAVAGFCMGNVMLFSFPAYFGISNLEIQFHHLFAWLNLVFCIPVTFYCAQPYFVSAYNSLKHRQINLDAPLALIVAVLFLRTAYSTIISDTVGFADTLTGLVFLLLMGKWLRQRTYHHLSFDRDYRSYFPIAVTTISEGREHSKAIADLVVGDRLLVRNGELVPADSILMRGDAWVDMSFVTGETEPKQKVLGEIIYAGGRQMGEAILLEVVKIPAQSYLTSLWNRENYTEKKGETFNDSIAKYFSIAVFSIALISFSYWMFNSDTTKAWAAFTAVIIVACPCVLALSTPFTLSAILAVFDRKGFYVKNTDAVEILAKCNAIVFDKTGTLTSAERADIDFFGNLSPDEFKLISALWNQSAHPLSRALAKRFKIPTDYVVNEFQERLGQGLIGRVEGKLIYVGNAKLLAGERVKLEDEGVHVMIDGFYKGRFVFKQSWRKCIPVLLQKLKAKFKFSVLSGDTRKDEVRLQTWFPPQTEMKFEQSPHDKLKAIALKQQSGELVMMLGDGLNDAGALKQSDFGIAVTENVSNFTPGCDAIMQASSLDLLPNFYQMSKDGARIIRLSFLIATLYNCIGLYFAVQGTLYPLLAAVLMPISTITIIIFTSIATRYYARKNSLIC